MIAVWFALLNLAEGALFYIWHHHHRVAAGLAVAVGWVIHRARRRVCHTGARVEGMPLLEAVAVRRPDLAPKPREATAA